MQKKYRVGIIGGGGYTAGELLRLLVHHPAVELAFAVSGSQAGKKVSSIHQDLIGEAELFFSAHPEEADVIFLCMGHGKSETWMKDHLPRADTLVIDLSRDFRQSEDWVYGLPELNRETIKASRRIANPGCFATAIQLAALPLAASGEVAGPYHVHAITGSTGAGQRPTATTHFSWRNNNVSIYKAFQHQHVTEINRSLRQVHPTTDIPINFLPLRGNFSRGIFASLYVDTALSKTRLQDLYHGYFAVSAFTHLVSENPHLKQVVNTNKGLVYVDKIDGKALVVSMIDNLLKGASGQAVQNMNLMFGLKEDLGLQLKAGVF